MAATPVTPQPVPQSLAPTSPVPSMGSTALSTASASMHIPPPLVAAPEPPVLPAAVGVSQEGTLNPEPTPTAAVVSPGGSWLNPWG